MTCLEGDAVWKAGDDGLWSWDLLEAAHEEMVKFERKENEFRKKWTTLQKPSVMECSGNSFLLCEYSIVAL